MLSSRNAHWHGSKSVDIRDEIPDNVRQSRPSHFRSRSYLSGLTTPIEIKPRNASTMPMDGAQENVEKLTTQITDDSPANSLLPRIHLPSLRGRQSQDLNNGKDHHLPRRTNSHRHTKSDVRDSNLVNDNSFLQPTSANRGMLNRVTSNVTNKTVGLQHKPRHQHSTSDFQRPPASGLSNATRPSVRRRATSDPRGPTSYIPGAQAQSGLPNYIVGSPESQISEISMLLEKSERARNLEKKATEEDVNRLSIQLAESNVELHEQLQNITQSYTNLMRRLDDAYFSLTSTAHSLIDTISSFQNLNQQSSTLARNFENKSRELNEEVHQSLEKHRSALYGERAEEIERLEDRSFKANERAEQLSNRLENCRIIVRNYTERQQTKQRAWKGVLVGSLWGFAVIIFSVLLGFGIWWFKTYGSIVEYDIRQAGSILSHVGFKNGGNIHSLVQSRAKEVERITSNMPFSKLPPDVRKVLDDIAVRHNGSYPSHTTFILPTTTPVNDSKLDKMFHKIEL